MRAGARRRVLAVDNEEVDRDLLRRLLEPAGFEVEPAASGEDALRRLREGCAPDAILMDLAMPGIDGWETIRRLRAEGLSAAPVAIVSANAFDRRLDNDLGVRAEDYVLKPVRGEELLDWLGAALAIDWRRHRRTYPMLYPPKRRRPTCCPRRARCARSPNRCGSATRAASTAGSTASTRRSLGAPRSRSGFVRSPPGSGSTRCRAARRRAARPRGRAWLTPHASSRRAGRLRTAPASC